MFFDNKKEMGKYAFFAVVAVLIVLSYFIVRSYFVALISAFILSYLVMPLFKIFEKKIGKTLSALLCILIVILIILLPMALVIGKIGAQGYEYFADGGLEELLESISASDLLGNLDLNNLTEAGSFLGSFLKAALSYVPSFLVSLFIVLFAMYYFLVSWDDLTDGLKKYLPFHDSARTTREIGKITNALVYGTFLVGLIEFVIAAIGFYFLGVRFALLLAALIFFLAFIPGAGPILVWVPLGIYYLIIGDYFTLIGVVVVGLILSIGVDSLARNRILSGRAGIHPLIMLVGVFGGISLFGIFGFIIGPLILAYTIEIVEAGVRS